jgi:hypothetical protein
MACDVNLQNVRASAWLAVDSDSGSNHFCTCRMSHGDGAGTGIQSFPPKPYSGAIEAQPEGPFSGLREGAAHGYAPPMLTATPCEPRDLYANRQGH